MAPQSKGGQKTQIIFLLRPVLKHLESSCDVVFLLLEFQCYL
jgi:hypothetical protein